MERGSLSFLNLKKLSTRLDFLLPEKYEAVSSMGSPSTVQPAAGGPARSYIIKILFKKGASEIKEKVS